MKLTSQSPTDCQIAWAISGALASAGTRIGQVSIRVEVVAALDHVADAFAAGMEGRAAAAVAAGIDQRGDLGLDALEGQRRGHERALELGVLVWRQMLELAAAADGEMRADRRGACRRRRAASRG